MKWTYSRDARPRCTAVVFRGSNVPPVSLQVKANSVKQEFEKQDELKRSAMRAVVALLTIPEAEKSPLMSEFQSQISSNQELAAIFDSIQRDSSSANMESMDTS